MRKIELELILDGDEEEAYDDVCDELVVEDFIMVMGESKRLCSVKESEGRIKPINDRLRDFVKDPLTDFGREPDRITAMINAMQKMERAIMGLALRVDRLERERNERIGE